MKRRTLCSDPLSLFRLILPRSLIPPPVLKFSKKKQNKNVPQCSQIEGQLAVTPPSPRKRWKKVFDQKVVLCLVLLFYKLLFLQGFPWNPNPASPILLACPNSSKIPRIAFPLIHSCSFPSLSTSILLEKIRRLIPYYVNYRPPLSDTCTNIQYPLCPLGRFYLPSWVCA